MQVVVTEASKAIQNVGNSWNLNSQILDMGRLVRMDSLTLGPAVLRSPSTGWKVNIKNQIFDLVQSWISDKWLVETQYLLQDACFIMDIFKSSTYRVPMIGHCELFFTAIYQRRKQKANLRCLTNFLFGQACNSAPEPLGAKIIETHLPVSPFFSIMKYGPEWGLKTWQD